VQTHDIAEFTIADMAECNSGLRQIGEGARNMEQTAGRIVAWPYESFRARGQQGPLALLRLFKTHPYRALKPNLQMYAGNLLGYDPNPAMKCPTLPGGVRKQPQWLFESRVFA
jgi:hypothetical protein